MTRKLGKVDMMDEIWEGQLELVRKKIETLASELQVLRERLVNLHPVATAAVLAEVGLLLVRVETMIRTAEIAERVHTATAASAVSVPTDAQIPTVAVGSGVT
jgi:hypothetical protein